jgi:hypothetical protein
MPSVVDGYRFVCIMLPTSGRANANTHQTRRPAALEVYNSQTISPRSSLGRADTTTKNKAVLILKTVGLRKMSADVCGHDFGAICARMCAFQGESRRLLTRVDSKRQSNTICPMTPWV